MVVKAPRGLVPQAAHIHGKVSRFNLGLVAGANQCVRWENPHQNADAENVVRVKAAVMGGNGFVFCHAGILGGVEGFSDKQAMNPTTLCNWRSRC
jgi:hypothetical protein